jgi:hypothetical protein
MTITGLSRINNPPVLRGLPFFGSLFDVHHDRLELMQRLTQQGDVTGRMMLVQSASHDGRVAAENAILGVGQPYRHKIVPHGGFTDPEYASVGLAEWERNDG